MLRAILAALVGGLSLSACAQAPQSAAATAVTAAASPADAAAAEKNAREALKAINPELEVDYVGPAPFAGFREVVVTGQLVYVSDDGNYLMQGSVLDVANRMDAAQASVGLANYRKQLIDSIPHGERIVFAPPNPVYTISVFTDVECGYCRKLHEQIADYNKQGIAVEYLAYPRMGLGSEDHKKMIAVWCAADPKLAMTEAKAGHKLATGGKECTNPVSKEYDIGQRVGVNGTPAIFNAEGYQVGGYLPPEQLRAALDKLAAGRDAPAGAR
ncbi:hypothetical protein CSC70_12340 [Pseudoxanthomonas kalamensis DSM 18571]|uniref:DsbC family protein n=1 Tax=Pseudoxanthomonas kalamensis TaxID=289483 RepID=UPI0013908A41|nr:DsbC family protein [Pseudoxanthomonas kalamensis]KAF1708970.1 hypothetical protein CSC70_12340 [Pseudoxanthomonas kalamensis DSM 18571]